MKIYYQKSLWDFRNECREDIKQAIEKLQDIGKLDYIENELNYEYSNGISDTDLHDLFLDDFDYILSLIRMTESSFATTTRS